MNDRLGQPSTTEIGTFGGIAYVQHDGIFEGQTSTGAYRVPYRITAPKDPHRANRTVLVEPPHFAAGLGTLNLWLGRDFLCSRGFAHGGVGWSMASSPDGGNLRILDPTVPGVFINGGLILAGGDGQPENGRTDDEIIANFARALTVDSSAQQMLGRVERRYLTGFSDCSDPVLRLVVSGRATGAFDLVIPFTADRGVPSTQGIDPQAALGPAGFGGKLMIVNSEAETFAGLVDRGVAPSQYRYYAAAGAPHASDPLVPFFANKDTPATWQPALRTHFLQADKWVRTGSVPPPSDHFKTSDGVTLDRDGSGNAISLDASGQPVPRLPFIELREAHFITGFRGSFDGVKKIADLGFTGHRKYLQAFKKAVDDYVRAGSMLKEDADAMRSRAALCPDLTFTETYRDHYDNFTAIVPCGG